MTVARPIITNIQARRIFMARQGLCPPPRNRRGKDGLHALIHQLGFVQMDSIRTVERAHHMILFAR
ncbi:MAG: winged helix-turn-helix domain-containing protein, partial [Alphaproteobacteria bacterium]